ncbi:SusD/RagB family nutrient-binding outer membrane lipoprotein [Sphingobacterium paucimobilis]|uniref:SusD/RagB family nutrient-binding outer membrane lipoprotein n=1 Tax=Sphingobacterium paucimobilis HER1398 TaxID=1346330 RepID=U2HWK1_9SPHI|nr:SusD/RagB family nutrient-binding outer membrane lipoprotein [Sphingobacterium paucimobilis]ERJ59645.1 hypothetical protein M472_12765 [Sphingobacterium paucimobilis HER1398]
MKNVIKASLIAIVISTSFSSCTKDFVDINTNPNQSAAVAPQSLIGPTIYKMVSANLDRNLRVNNEFMQVTVTTNENREFHRYSIRSSETEYMWRSWFLELTNIRDMYQRAEQGLQPGYQTYQGISLILDAWTTSLLTDMYGDIPYFESNLGYKENNTTPYFDKQIDIYRDLFLKLERANALLKENKKVEDSYSNFDPLFATNPEQWRKFGNSLYLRLLLRVSHKAELNPIVKLKEILESNTAEYPIMLSNDDSAVLRFQSQEPYINPFFNLRDIDFNGNKGYSEFFINNMLNLQDPRLKTWATEASLGVYGGMQSGYPKGSVPEVQSVFPTTLKGTALLGNIMNYAEVKFIIAELMEKDIIFGDSYTAYKEGVESSITLWGSTLPTDYFANEYVAFLDSDNEEQRLKKIHLQKYLTLMFTDFQQWYEYRRTGLLDLYIGTDLENDGKMPIRLTYPLIVQSLNKKNYDDAVARLGQDAINKSMWWQIGLTQ